jgi:hypothetical protein
MTESDGSFRTMTLSSFSYLFSRTQRRDEIHTSMCWRRVVSSFAAIELVLATCMTRAAIFAFSSAAYHLVLFGGRQFQPPMYPVLFSPLQLFPPSPFPIHFISNTLPFQYTSFSVHFLLSTLPNTLL